MGSLALIYHLTFLVCPFFDMLKQKRPEPGNVEPSTFMLCDTVPPLSDLDMHYCWSC